MERPLYYVQAEVSLGFHLQLSEEEIQYAEALRIPLDGYARHKAHRHIIGVLKESCPVISADITRIEQLKELDPL